MPTKIVKVICFLERRDLKKLCCPFRTVPHLLHVCMYKIKIQPSAAGQGLVGGVADPELFGGVGASDFGYGDHEGLEVQVGYGREVEDLVLVVVYDRGSADVQLKRIWLRRSSARLLFIVTLKRGRQRRLCRRRRGPGRSGRRARGMS